MWRWLLLIGLLVIGVLSQPSASVAQSPATRKVALIVANADYAHAGRLTNPTNDARLIAESARRAGFESVTLSPDLNLAGFQRALRDFRTLASGAQVAMVYYAGHGIEGGGKNWLIPVDANLASDLDLPYEAIDLDRVMEAMSGARIRMVVLDACRNNPFGRSWRSGSRAVTRGLAQIDADDVLVIYAAAPGQTASDGTGANSPFATSLAQRLIQPDLAIQLLGGAVRDDVLASTGGEQRPFVSASITGTPVYLVPRAASTTASSPAAAAMTVDSSTLDALTWQGAVGANSIAAFNEYKRQFPQGRFVLLADQNIARLQRPASPPPAQRAETTTQGSAGVGAPTATMPTAAPPQPVVTNMASATTATPATAPVTTRQQLASSGTGRIYFPDSSQSLIDLPRLRSMSAAELIIARNEIYARHGYAFTAPELRAHFSQFNWYSPAPGTLQMNEIEQTNARLMKQVERTPRTSN